jgi:hypothetical protein
MFNVFVYYKDMVPIISHPKVIYEYMESIGWDCDWNSVENTHRGIDTKEHKEAEKRIGVSEFMKVIDEWNESNYPIINVKDSIQSDFEMIKHHNGESLFDIDSIEVGFTNYYAKNKLFGMFLNLREYLTGYGTYNLIKDSYENDKINISFIERTLLAIKIVTNCSKNGLWEEISNTLADFYNQYSTIDNGIHKDNKKQFEAARNNIIQGIWDKLSERIDDDMLKLAFQSNYQNVTENLITDFMEGIKLVCTMYLDKKSVQKKINGKNTKVNIYSWSDDTLSKYEIRDDKKTQNIGR